MSDLFTNPYFIIPVITFFIAQLAKFGIRIWREGSEGGIKLFFGSGNMPSSHTAMVTALVLTAAFEDGLGSSELGISFVLASIVIYDSLNIRRAVGEQGGALQRLIDRSRTAKSEREKLKISEVLGHRPIEVFAGAMLALVITLVLEQDKWWDSFYNGLTNVSDAEITTYYVLSAGIIIIGLAIVAFFRRRNLRKLPTSKSISRVATRALIIPGFFGLLFTWLLQEDVARFDSAIWVFLVAVWVVVALIVGYFKTFRGSIARLKAEQEHFSEEKKRQRQSRRKKKGRKRH